MQPILTTAGDREINKVFDHIFENAFGNPIIFTTEPTLDSMKANTWGLYDGSLYIKFANATGLVISGVAMT
jgi:hypothetical protein